MTARWDQRVCLAAAYFIADRVSADRSTVDVIDVPEMETGNQGKKLELICSVGGEEVAFEHTLIESYKNELRDGQHISEFMDKVAAQLKSDLPPGTFTIAVPTDVVLGLTGNRAQEVAVELATWIEPNAKAIADAYKYEDPATHSSDIDGPIKGRIWFRPGDASRTPKFARFTPNALEHERAERIKVAYESKLPKLFTEREKGRSRCLVFEDRDTSLGNAALIRSAALAALTDLRDIEPEWLLLVETDIDPAEWLVLAHNGDWPDFDHSEFSQIGIPKTLDK